METTTHTPDTPSTPETPDSRANRLERPTDRRVLAGVAAGIADRMNVSVGLVRLGFLVSALFGGFGVLLYLAAWVLMPEAGETDSAADRWLDRLRDPNRRVGAILIGAAVAIVVVSLAPIAVVALAALVIGGAMLSSERRSSAPASTTDETDPVNAPSAADHELDEPETV
jgi:phage shock protein PspC (stress-responsive transcriptional regulator)